MPRHLIAIDKNGHGACGPHVVWRSLIWTVRSIGPFSRFVGGLSVAAYLLLVPLGAVTFGGIGGHDLARVTQLALGLACALAVLLVRWRDATAIATRYLLILALCGGLAILSMRQAAVPTMAARQLALLAGLVAVAGVVTGLHCAEGKVVHIAAAASSIYVAVILLVIAMAFLNGSRLNRAELFVGYDNYRFFNHVQSAALPLAVLAMTVAPRGGWLRRVAWFSAFGGFALLFAAAGRGTLVGIAIGAAVIGAVFGRASFATLRSLAVAAALGLLLFALLFWLLPLLTGITPEFSEGYYGARLGSIEARFFLWRIAQTYIEQSPWLGIGPMHYAHIHNPEAAHPHNVYLQIAAEWGVPMLLLLVGAGIWTLRGLVRAVRRCQDERQRDCGVGLVLACVAIAVDGLFSGNFVMPVSQVWIAFTFGWAMAWMASQRSTVEPVPPVGRQWIGARRIALLALLASQLWLVWSVWPEVRRLDEHINETLERFPNATMNPRFWSHGWF